MDDIYFLKHKDDLVGIVSIDSIQGTILSYKAINSELAPYLGNADLEKIKRWWQTRAVPGSRAMIDDLIKNAGCYSNYEYLAKNLGLSVTDSYWICPVDSSLEWKDVSLFSNNIKKKGVVPYHNASSYDPNASLGGKMEKYWDISDEGVRLVKTASAYFGQQAANEELASIIHNMQHTDIMYVDYITQRREIDNALQCVCDAFTSSEIELISALEVVDSEKKSNDISQYEHFLNVVEKYGLNREQVQRFLDYQTLSDFLISNTDRHLLNFGILRAADSFKIISYAPLYDSGNSMFYSEQKSMPYNRVELLSREITAIHSAEEKMLKTVLFKNVFNVNCIPSPKDVMDFYVLKGIPEEKASFISKNYDLKAVMLNEFIQGKLISLYNEKQKLRGHHQ